MDLEINNTLNDDEDCITGIDNILDNFSNKNTIITGGTMELPGSIEFAERVLEARVRIGFPSGINNLVEELSGPAFTSCTGMLLHSILMQENEIKNKSKNNNFAVKIIEKIMGSGF